jgi:hypothetical protein
MFNTIVGARTVGAGAALRYNTGSDQMMRLLAAPAPQHCFKSKFLLNKFREEIWLKIYLGQDPDPDVFEMRIRIWSKIVYKDQEPEPDPTKKVRIRPRSSGSDQKCVGRRFYELFLFFKNALAD